MVVLILDDDELSRNHLQSLLEQKGVSLVKSVDNEEDFNFILSIEDVDLVIVDCLLPGEKNGIDIVQTLNTTRQLSIWLTSGVIQDSAINQKTLSNKVDFFLKKPFRESEIDIALGQIKNSNKNPSNDEFSNTEGVYSVFYKKDFFESDLDGYLKNNPVFKGHEVAVLIYLCSYIRFSGQIILTDEQKKVSRLTFLQGQLCNIQAPHKKSYFGVLLAVHELVPISDIKTILKKKSDQRIGDRLVAEGHLSPHNVMFILEEQSKIRLSEMLDSSNTFQVEVKQNICSLEEMNTLDTKKIQSILLHILPPKVENKWYHSFFSIRSHFVVNKNTDDIIPHSKWTQKCQAIIQSIDGVKNTEQLKQDILSRHQWKEHEFYFCMYYLLIGRWISFKESVEVVEKNIRSKAFHFQKRMQTEDYFSILNLSKNAKEFEIKKRLLQMMKIFHPDRYDQCSSDVKKACNDIAFRLNQINKVLLDSVEREKYIQSIDKEQKVNLVTQLGKYNQAKKLLENSEDPKQALSLLEPIKNHTRLFKDIQLYYFLAVLKNKPAVRQVIDVSQQLESVMLELKYSYLYYFVKSLCAFKLKDTAIGVEYLEKCLAIKKDFLPARLEKAKRKKHFQNDKNTLKRFFKVS